MSEEPFKHGRQFRLFVTANDKVNKNLLKAIITIFIQGSSGSRIPDGTISDTIKTFQKKIYWGYLDYISIEKDNNFSNWLGIYRLKVHTRTEADEI